MGGFGAIFQSALRGGKTKFIEFFIGASAIKSFVRTRIFRYQEILSKGQEKHGRKGQRSSTSFMDTLFHIIHYLFFCLHYYANLAFTFPLEFGRIQIGSSSFKISIESKFSPAYNTVSFYQLYRLLRKKQVGSGSGLFFEDGFGSGWVFLEGRIGSGSV